MKKNQKKYIQFKTYKIHGKITNFRKPNSTIDFLYLYIKNNYKTFNKNVYITNIYIYMYNVFGLIEMKLYFYF